MGDLRHWSPEANGVALEERSSSSSSSSSSSLSSHAVIRTEFLHQAEEVTRGIIAQIQPNLVSEDRRAAVIDYVQTLFRRHVGLEVFPFGSVPLKTYLPDGDIDLTAFGGLPAEESLAKHVCRVLEGEDRSEEAEFVVKDVQFISAEVKLVKCIIQNIVVDISFNQLGGLCTLCFLEKVDRLIGKDHLFKRSIILVKAWCYYESRILGAHHGLISTYALETLVLYIFHLFHSSLDGPLAVLYKFLDYYSKFDWDKYCVGLSGPILISSLPEVVVETPENSGGELLLSKDFLTECVENFSVPANGFGANARSFVPKHLNIVDPLKENNNLGRSVSKGSFFRIRSAFSFGVRKLGKVLSDPEMDIADELREIFSNTLDRHGNGQRPDVQDPIPLLRCDNVDVSQENNTSVQTLSEVQPSLGRYAGMFELENTANVSAISDCVYPGQANDLASSRSSTSSNGSVPSSSLSSAVHSSQLHRPYHAPHLYFPQLSTETGETRHADASQECHEPSAKASVTPIVLQTDVVEPCVFSDCNLDKNELTSSNEVMSPAGSKIDPSFSRPLSWTSDDAFAGYCGAQASSNTSRRPEQFNSLADLSGDNEINLENLQCGRWYYDSVLSAQISQVSSSLFPQFPVKNSWDVVRRSVQLRQNGFSRMNPNVTVTGRPFYPIKSHIVSGSNPFGAEEMPKPRGTGTYFPNMNHYKERNSIGWGRNSALMKSPRNNGRGLTPLETNFSERSSDFPQTWGKSWSPDQHNSGSPARNRSGASGPAQQSEGVLEFGSFGHNSRATLPQERGQQSISGSVPSQRTSAGQSTSAGIEWPPVNGTKQDRMPLRSYHLKDEDDFPPLSDSNGKG